MSIEAPPLERKLVAILAADVEGYSRLMHLDAPAGAVHVVQAVLRERRGTNGFGYDPIFLPDGHELTTAEMSAEEKDAIRHRGIAFRALADRLPALLG